MANSAQCWPQPRPLFQPLRDRVPPQEVRHREESSVRACLVQGAGPPQAGTEARELRERMRQPQAAWDTCHLPIWVLPAQVLRDRRMPQMSGPPRGPWQSLGQQDVPHPSGTQLPPRRICLDPRLSPVCATLWPLACGLPTCSCLGSAPLPYPGLALRPSPTPSQASACHTTTSEPQSHGTPTEHSRLRKVRQVAWATLLESGHPVHPVHPSRLCSPHLGQRDRPPGQGQLWGQRQDCASSWSCQSRITSPAPRP